jgi:Niemann-Pick C1 protein
MPRLLILTLGLISLCSLSQAYESKGHCVWYDVCGPDPELSSPSNPHCLNCHYEGQAKKLDQEFEYLVKEACPHLFDDLEGDLTLCCSPAQLKDLVSNFQMANNFLGRCPTCMYNFRKNFCDMTCRPDQSLFLKTKTVMAPKRNCTQSAAKLSKRSVNF